MEVVVLLSALAIMLAAARLGGYLAVRMGQPAVLGELVAGVLLGNAGLPLSKEIAAHDVINAIALVGVILLLFQVGLESTVREMLKVGASSLLVALVGVVTPFALGWGVGAWMLPGHSPYVHAYLGAALTATSVGITARVLADLGRSRTPEARIILGAAVIDDILGLVILAVVTGIVRAADSGAALDLVGIVTILMKAALFLGGAIYLGPRVAPHLFGLASRLERRGVLLAAALVFCFTLSWLASVVGLAAIVGAYAAGLVLDDIHVRGFSGRGTRGIEDELKPVGALLIPVFFVLMGMRVDLSAFGRSEVLGLALLLTVAAIIGKQACALGALERGLDRLSIGIGMIPRGEVGLIFAGMGLTLTLAGERIVDESLYSAIVIMVILTTLVTPPALKWSLGRKK